MITPKSGRVWITIFNDHAQNTTDVRATVTQSFTMAAARGVTKIPAIVERGKRKRCGHTRWQHVHMQRKQMAPVFDQDGMG